MDEYVESVFLSYVANLFAFTEVIIPQLYVASHYFAQAGGCLERRGRHLATGFDHRGSEPIPDGVVECGSARKCHRGVDVNAVDQIQRWPKPMVGHECEAVFAEIEVARRVGEVEFGGNQLREVKNPVFLFFPRASSTYL